MRTLLLVLLALTVVVSLQTVGVGLVAAMLVTPGATAYLLTRRLSDDDAGGRGVGAVSSVVGLYLSYYLNVASGAAVVLTATGFFVLAYLFAPRRGLVVRWARRGHGRGGRRGRARPERPRRRRPVGGLSLVLAPAQHAGRPAAGRR